MTLCDWTGSCIPYDSGPLGSIGDIGTSASFPSGPERSRPGRRPPSSYLTAHQARGAGALSGPPARHRPTGAARADERRTMRFRR
ncbi:hypothetical protein GCM10010504_27540 [Streptomyces griseus]|nr:hypothetical protein GCM10010504_27540 [Streptomyces griseus]